MKTVRFSLNFSIFLLFAIWHHAKSAVITTSLGKLNGDQTGPFHLFKNIPFAKPPLGNLRFQKPELPDKWQGVRDAKEYGPACLSNSSETQSPQKWVDEDCLQLNIFTSDKCLTSKDCAVVVYVHGGAINYDSAVMFNDTFLLGTFVSRDVILVIPAFRLGIFSHFVVQDQNIAPSNLALYDIIHALEFVKREISNFGGNNKRVTFFGHSYGGSITSIMSFSTKINQDLSLFQQVVSMSSPDQVDTLDFQIAKTRNFSRRAGCLLPPILAKKFSQNQQDLYSMKCLQKMDSLELLRIQREMEDEGHPKPEHLILRGPLLQEVPYHRIPNIPMLTGCTRSELDTKVNFKSIAEVMGMENPKEVDAKYRKDLREGNYDFQNHTDKTQTFIIQTKKRVEKLITNGVPAYLYEYTYPKHATHTDDLFYLMGVHRFEKDENEEHLSEIYRRIFTNFAKTGHPGEGFELANLENSTYFDVFWDEKTGRRPQMRADFEKNILDYWFKDMVAYDKSISAAKKAQKHTPTARFYSGTMPKYQYPYMYMTLLIIAMIFLTGCIVGRICCRGNRDLYIRLDGTDGGFHNVKGY